MVSCAWPTDTHFRRPAWCTRSTEAWRVPDARSRMPQSGTSGSEGARGGKPPRATRPRARSEAAQMPVLARDRDRGKRRRSRRYVEHPQGAISCQGGQMRRRSSALVRHAGWGRRLAIVAGLALSARACRTPGALRALPHGDPRPQLLLDAFERSAEARRSLRGRARIQVEGGSGMNLAGRQILVAERPARLRIEVLGLFDQALAVLTTVGERFELFRSADLSFEEGELRPGLLWEQAHIALRPEEAIALLLGAPPPEPGLVPVRAEGAEDGTIRVALAVPGCPERRRLRFDGEG